MTRLPTSPWPRRAAWIAFLATLPIFLIGGTVTTLRVGMAVPDWPTTFGHNMFTYPLEDMLRNTGVFWEHTHRLWGSLVGAVVVALGLVIAFAEPRRSVRWLALAAFVGVCLQGLLGGIRVRENSVQLALVHGAAAQAFFGLLAAIVVLESRAWLAAAPRRVEGAGGLHRLALAAPLVVYAQTVLGAWLRHTGVHAALWMHVGVAVLAAVLVLALAGGLRASGDAALARSGRWLRGLVWLQVLLGVLSAVWVFLVTGPHNPVSVGEAVFATAHVACGALLFAATVAALLLTRRTVLAADAPLAAHAGLEGAR